MRYTINGIEYTTRVGDTVVADGFALHVPGGKPLAVIYFYDEESRCPLGWEVMKNPTPSHLSSAFRKSCMMLGRIPEVVRIDGERFREAFSPNEDDFNEVLTIIGIAAGCDVDLGYRSLPTMHYLSRQQCRSMDSILHTVGRLFELQRNGRQHHNHLAGRTPRDVFENGRCPVNMMSALDMGTMNWLWRNEVCDLAVASC
ncbi:MAG: hypothetical protein IJU76_08490 [Desulfovibrionaceae bacterium]|nr:hypothetical protein [Desulfovibrionaceae bacterium]